MIICSAAKDNTSRFKTRCRCRPTQYKTNVIAEQKFGLFENIRLFRITIKSDSSYTYLILISNFFLRSHTKTCIGVIKVPYLKNILTTLALLPGSTFLKVRHTQFLKGNTLY